MELINFSDAEITLCKRFVAYVRPQELPSIASEPEPR